MKEDIRYTAHNRAMQKLGMRKAGIDERKSHKNHHYEALLALNVVNFVLLTILWAMLISIRDMLLF